MADNLENSKKEFETRQKILATQKEISKSAKDTSNILQEQRKIAEEIREEFGSFGREYLQINKKVRSELKGQSDSANVYLSINKRIAKLTVQEKHGAADIVELASKRKDILQDISNTLLNQAKATAGVTEEMSEFDEARMRVAEQYNDLVAEQRDIFSELNENNLSAKQIEDGIGGTLLRQKQEALAITEAQLRQDQEQAKRAIDLREELYMKEVRLNELKEQAAPLYDMLPASLQSGVDFTKQLIAKTKQYGMALGVFAILVAVIGSAVKLFEQLDESAAKFREETGLTRSQMEGLNQTVTNVIANYAHLGIEAGDVFNVVSALKEEFADFAQFSEAVVSSIAVLGANFGVAATDAAKVQNIFESIGGLSAETAANVQLQVVEMANLAGVAPAKVMKDIAESGEAASTFFRGNVDALARAAVEARRLGSNLQTTVKVAEQLLDFQSSIEKELEAQAFVGGQFNLSQARALAATGDTVKAQEEVLRQLQRSGDFRLQDMWTQRALAEAAGMSVEEITKQLNIQERLNSLSAEERKMAQDAIDAGIDITNINEDQLAQEVKRISLQQEQQASLEQLQNAFTGIVTTVGSSLIPLLETIAPLLHYALWPIQQMAEGLNWIVSGLREAHPLAIALGAAMLPLALRGVITAISGIWTSFSKIPFGVGIPLAIAAGATLLGAISSAMTNVKEVGDMAVPATGRTMVSTREGGLFELSPNDDLIAAPNLLQPQASTSPVMGVSDVHIKDLLTEIRGLRQDMREGKVGVYMDGRKVTAAVSRVVDNMGINDYGIV